ncbi:MAG TPA: condensation domain-containing protein [Acidimicrobiales bacterium]|jgi:acyl carrier protein|nr:condensation domain-containing protein [Acidimicrobiales bacterium]
MWRRVLARESIGGDDSFFRLGGDAVAASELLALIRDAFDVDIGGAELRAAPTVGGLVAAIERRLGEGTGPPAADTAPIGFSQEGMLWYEQFAPGSFNMAPFVRRYQGPLDVGALQRSLAGIIGRHGALRSTFQIAAGRPVQRIHPPDAFSLPVVDLAGMEPAERHAEISRRIDEAARRPFDLTRGPLFLPSLIRLGPDDHVLIIRLHHLVFDDWAVDVFRRELSASYRAHVTGSEPELPPLPIDFPEFCRRQRRRLAGVEGAEQLAFWRRELAGAPWTTQLPIEDPGRPRGSRHRAVGPRYYPLPDPLVDGLRLLARRVPTTLFMALLTVFGVVTRNLTGQDDLLLASVVANRNRAELEPMIGCFTKKIVLRLNLAGDPNFLELAPRVRDALLRSLAHQDLPFETVVQQVLGPSASAHGLVPELSTMFQAETPRRQQVTLPGLTVGGYDSGSPNEQAHFSSGDPDGASSVWGGGLYRSTFLILSVLEGPDGVSLVARGAFHPPAVDALVAQFVETLGRVVADPNRRLGALTAPAASPLGVADLGGFEIEPARIEAALAAHPGVSESRVEVRRDQAVGDRLVASIVPAGGARDVPTIAQLRRRIWEALPGYAWPVEVVVDGRPDGGGLLPEAVPDARTGPSERDLARRWEQILAAGPVHDDANYWQRFSFLDALRSLGSDGLAAATSQVMRNRTLRTLAADLATDEA